jgi:hypothetical protein
LRLHGKRTPLPPFRYTQTMSMPEKWRKNAALTEPALGVMQGTGDRLQALPGKSPAARPGYSVSGGVKLALGRLLPSRLPPTYDRMYTPSLAATLILALSATGAPAVRATPAEQAKSQLAADSKPDSKPDLQPASNRKTCRHERPVDSLISTRAFKTVAQWDKDSEDSRKLVEVVQQRTGSTGGR